MEYSILKWDFPFSEDWSLHPKSIDFQFFMIFQISPIKWLWTSQAWPKAKWATNGPSLEMSTATLYGKFGKSWKMENKWISDGMINPQKMENLRLKSKIQF